MKTALCEEITVRIKPLDEIIQIEEHRDGTVSVKNIGLDSLVQCFQSSIKENKIIESGFLPDRCISYNVTNKKKTLTLLVPAHYIDFTYFNTVYERFPMPHMVFGVSVDNSGRTSGHRLAVIGEGRPIAKAPLYEYPFSNVYDHFGICIGAGNSLPLYKNLQTLSSLPDFILSFPNNDHMFFQSRNKLKLGYRNLLEHLKDKDPSYYYTNVLVPLKRNRVSTLQDFINKKLGGEL